MALVGKAAELLARELRHPRYVTALFARCGELAQAADVDTRAAQDLQRPWVHHVGLRRAVRSLAPLDDEARDAESREQQRGHEADRTRADDEHRDLNARHRSLPWRRAA